MYYTIRPCDKHLQRLHNVHNHIERLDYNCAHGAATGTPDTSKATYTYQKSLLCMPAKRPRNTTICTSHEQLHNMQIYLERLNYNRKHGAVIGTPDMSKLEKGPTHIKSQGCEFLQRCSATLLFHSSRAKSNGRVVRHHTVALHRCRTNGPH